MKALVLTDTTVLSYQDTPDPVVDDDNHLIRVVYSGICGSDMHAFLGHDARRPTPIILGHEAAGIVVGGPDEGRRVTINPLVTCGTCRDCLAGRTNICANRQIISMPPRPGAFADFVAMPADNLVTVPDGLPLHSAALAEPMACGWHAVRLALGSFDEPAADLRALVIGGGAIGLGAALALSAEGVADVTLVEPNPLRAECLSAQPQFTTRSDTPDTGTFDIVVEAVGYAATRAAACAAARPGGVIAHIGLGEDSGGLDVRRLTLQEIRFIGTYTYTAQDFRDTAQAIFEGRLGALDWVEVRALADGQAAFDDIRNGRVAAPKIILEP